jgi:hypothetical protein
VSGSSGAQNVEFGKNVYQIFEILTILNLLKVGVFLMKKSKHFEKEHFGLG